MEESDSTAQETHPGEASSAWKMLVVDDDESVLQVTRLSLIGFEFQGRPVELLYASSGAAAREIYHQHSDIAIILLDVMMETDEAGFEFADYVRKDMHDPYVRIIIRTGQASRFSIPDVMSNYDVNDFVEKVDLTADRMYVMLYSALRDREFLLAQDHMREELSEMVHELRASNEKLEVFAYMAGHDLQAPLRKISWRVKRAAEALQDGQDAAVIEAEVQAVDRNCRYLAGLLESLLKYAHLKNAPIQLQQVSLDTVLQNVLSNLESDLRECQGTVSLPAAAGEVRGDPNLLTTLFQNLVANSLKFVKPKMLPVVSITSSESELPGSGKPAICIEISDQGVGIEPEAIETIFEPFGRAQSTQEFEGSGLGLSIARQVVQEHGGSIAATSELGVGTTIRAWLPVKGPTG